MNIMCAFSILLRRGLMHSFLGLLVFVFFLKSTFYDRVGADA